MVTPEQIAILRRMIARSGDGNDLAKCILIFLVNASNNCARQIAVTISQDDHGYSREKIIDAAVCVGMMCSSSSLTQLNELMGLMGTTLRFGRRRGYYGESGIFKDEAHSVDAPVRHTFWLSFLNSGNPGERNLTIASRATLQSIGEMVLALSS